LLCRDDGTGKKKLKKAKRKRDPSYPKRPLTAYNLFCEVMRPTILKENNSINPVDVSKTLGKMWKNVGDQVGEVYRSQV
jgi:hypothetical protein